MRTSILFALVPCLLFAQGPRQGRMAVQGEAGGRQAQGLQQPGSAQAEPIAVKPEDLGSVSGTVTSAITGEPLRKAQVQLFGGGSGARRGRPITAPTDAAGRFTLTNVEPGTYRLSASRNGFVRQEFGARHPGRAGTSLTVNKAQHLSQLTLPLTPHGVITGRIVDEEGEPLQGVQVQAMRTGYAQGRKQLLSSGGASTDDRGIYRIYSLAPGKYFISATARSGRIMMMQQQQGPAEAYASTYFPGTNDPSTAAPIDVMPGAEVPSIDIRLMKTTSVTVSGKVGGLAAGPDRARGFVTLVPAGSSSFNMFDRRPGAITPQGTFEIRGVTAGSYTLVAAQVSPTYRASAQMPVQVGQNDIDGISISLVPAASLTGAVRAEGAAVDLSGVRVMLRPAENSVPFPGMGGGFGPGGGGPDRAQYNKDGTFTLPNTMTGVYNVNVSGLPAGYYVRSIRYGQEDALTRLDLSQGVAGALDIRVAGDGGTLSGTAVDDKKQASANVSVVIAPAGNKHLKHLYRMISTDETGSFSAAGLAPGDYLVYAFETIESGANQDPDYLKDFDRYAEKITLGPKESQTKQLIVIPSDKVLEQQ